MQGFFDQLRNTQDFSFNRIAFAINSRRSIVACFLVSTWSTESPLTYSMQPHPFSAHAETLVAELSALVEVEHFRGLKWSTAEILQEVDQNLAETHNMEALVCLTLGHKLFWLEEWGPWGNGEISNIQSRTRTIANAREPNFFLQLIGFYCSNIGG